MPERRQNLKYLTSWLLLPAFCLATASSRAWSTSSTSLDSPVVSHDSRVRLQQIEKQRQEFHKRAAQVRKQEQIALVNLSHIQHKLNETKGVLHEHEHKLKKTETNIQQTGIQLNKTKSAEEILSENAANRLREIFEGQRISLMEMLFRLIHCKN